MQRDGGKLSDVLDGAVPCQPVVEIGHHAQIDSLHARLLQNPLHGFAVAAGGEENLVDEVLARLLEEGIQRAHHFARCRGIVPRPAIPGSQISMNPLKV